MAVTTVHQTAIETSKTAISALLKRPSGAKRQKSTQSFYDEKFATKDLDREFLSIRIFRHWFAPPISAIHPPPQNLITGDRFDLPSKCTLILVARGIFRVQPNCNVDDSFDVAGR